MVLTGIAGQSRNLLIATLLLLAQPIHAQTTDFMDSLFNLYPKELPYPEDVDFEVEADSTISVSLDNEQCTIQRWLQYPGAAIMMNYAPADCANFAPALVSISFNGQAFSIKNTAFFQNNQGVSSQLSWYADEAWHKMTLGKANYYYTHLTISNCNGTVCSHTFSVIIRELNKQYTPFFFYNEGADLEIIDVDQDEMLDIVATSHYDEITGSFAGQNNHTEIHWLELGPSGKFEAVKDPAGQLYEINVRYPQMGNQVDADFEKSLAGAALVVRRFDDTPRSLLFIVLKPDF